MLYTIVGTFLYGILNGISHIDDNMKDNQAKEKQRDNGYFWYVDTKGRVRDKITGHIVYKTKNENMDVVWMDANTHIILCNESKDKREKRKLKHLADIERTTYDYGELTKEQYLKALLRGRLYYDKDTEEKYVAVKFHIPKCYNTVQLYDTLLFYVSIDHVRIVRLADSAIQNNRELHRDVGHIALYDERVIADLISKMNALLLKQFNVNGLGCLNYFCGNIDGFEYSWYIQK